MLSFSLMKSATGNRTQVLVVCMFDSIHSARWLSQFQDKEIDFVLFPSSPHRKIHNRLKELLRSSGEASYRLVTGSKYFGLPAWLLDKFLDNLVRGLLLRRIILRVKPDVLHALELQNAGYIALKALEGFRAKPRTRFIATNWGSDIFWFQQFPKHREKLQQLLALADEYSCECKRDVELARRLGFAGIAKPVFPNAGGFTKAQLELGQGAKPRNSLAIKGYHGWVGRAKIALDALELISAELRDLEINVYSANWSTIRHARKIARSTGLKIKTYAKGALSHDQMLNLFAKSRVYVGLSLSDGISTSLLEAMAMGAIPVQTSTACCNEWFTDTGVAVDTINPSVVSKAILEALKLSETKSAADKNRETIATKASAELITAGVANFYQ